jgi:hypothetical protein
MYTSDSDENNIVRLTIDPKNPPPLTPSERAELEAIAAMPDDQIDFSDIPPLTKEFWKNGVRGRFYRGNK